MTRLVTITLKLGTQTLVFQQVEGATAPASEMLLEVSKIMARVEANMAPTAAAKPESVPTGRGVAYVIATALYARAQTGDPSDMLDVDGRLYDAIESLGYGGDEVKADLYAQMAEQLTSTTTFADAVKIIEACLAKTNRTFFNG